VKYEDYEFRYVSDRKILDKESIVSLMNKIMNDEAIPKSVLNYLVRSHEALRIKNDNS
jgi:hypothetical protein